MTCCACAGSRSRFPAKGTLALETVVRLRLTLPPRRWRFWLGCSLVLLLAIALQARRVLDQPMTATLLSDPFLQAPTADTVRVVWFTDFPGRAHVLHYGPQLARRAIATTQPLTRMREDADSRIPEPPAQPTRRLIWRHEAIARDLAPGQRYPYAVSSEREDGSIARSREFSLAPSPPATQPLQILLTSDHQLMPLTAANLQQVVATVGRVDAVFLAGDLVNIPDRASEWFDDARGCAFFPCLQGRGQYVLSKAGRKTLYRGGELIQHAPLFAAVGNHEVMGRYSMRRGLNAQFDDPWPRAAAEQLYEQRAAEVNPRGDPAIRDAWLRAHSFNTDSYQEILTLPTSSTGGETYYATTFGPVRLVVLFATNIWRSPSLEGDRPSRYREAQRHLDNPEQWRHGQHIFAPITVGSPQYRWLQQELASPEFQQAPYKLVMLHHPPHTLGDNIVPAYTDPQPQREYGPDGELQAVRYEYPLDQDYLIRDVMPLLRAAGVHLVHFGHSHLWNRFTDASGMHFLETSNVGNTYGAAWGEHQRAVPTGYRETYVAQGDPNGLDPIVPNLAPLRDAQGQPLPYLASNDITAFSILDTSRGTVSSYYFDTRQPDSGVVKFDEFALH